jgi:hypothetical protein
VPQGYRVITTSVIFIVDVDEAIKFALKGRSEGKRTEIVTEEEFPRHCASPMPMQDLTEFLRFSKSFSEVEQN